MFTIYRFTYIYFYILNYESSLKLSVFKSLIRDRRLCNSCGIQMASSPVTSNWPQTIQQLSALFKFLFQIRSPFHAYLTRVTVTSAACQVPCQRVHSNCIINCQLAKYRSKLKQEIFTDTSCLLFIDVV